MNHCDHGVFMPREYPQRPKWNRVQVQCLECGKDFTYWEDRDESHLEALPQD